MVQHLRHAVQGIHFCVYVSIHQHCKPFSLQAQPSEVATDGGQLPPKKWQLPAGLRHVQTHTQEVP